MNFIKKWNGKGIADNYSVMSDEAKCFIREFKSFIKNIVKEVCPGTIPTVEIKSGHYDLFGFVKVGEKMLYVSYNIPRGEMPVDFSQGGCGGVLLRTVKSFTDYTGGPNHFCSVEHLTNVLKTYFIEGFFTY